MEHSAVLRERNWRFAARATVMLAALSCTAASGDEFFAEQVAPVFERRCLSCHNDAVAEGDFSLADGRALRESGYADSDDVDENYLLQLISPVDGAAEMPKDARPLSPTEITAIRKWIAAGAPWPADRKLAPQRVASRDWWSLQPLKRHDVPPSRARNPVDAFVDAKLDQLGLAPVESADAATLVRRITYDLTGLPPTPAEVLSFLTDAEQDADKAWLSLVNRLLGSAAFGEKWGQHWLDLARYAETHGYDKDKPRENAWPYRDYVIRSFNEDKPYTRFVQEQVAGDVLFPSQPNGILGLGFLAAGPWDFISHSEVGEGKLDGRIAKHIDRDEMASCVFNVMLSTTVQCAQCHDHKFDPIQTKDYYRLHAVFAAIDRADRIVPAANSNQTSSESGTGQWVYAASTQFEPSGEFKPTGGEPRPIHLLSRGDLKAPGIRLTPGAPSLWPGAPDVFFESSDWKEGDARSTLASYLTHRDNPLLWRSMANRLWQWAIGRPLVGTPNDFGRGGMQPSHPELLDFLAASLRDDERHSLKSIVRLIVTSNAYRRSSRSSPDQCSIDADNRFIWRANRRRLTAEEFRDSALAFAGVLDRTIGGPSYKDFVVESAEHSPHYSYHLHDPAALASHRRTVYRFVVRSQPQPLLTALDCADPSVSTPQRNESTTAIQALAAWNNSLVEFCALRFGRRIEQHSNDPSAQVRFAIRTALGREPAPLEQEILATHLAAHGPANMARILLNMNAFVYID